ncbi:MAG: metallophosphoesterase [Phycisphaerae bacterium]
MKHSARNDIDQSLADQKHLDGFVVSDLHLFAQRSVGGVFQQEMQRAAAGADFFVLAGDIFDFEWSTVGSVAQSVLPAMAWVRELIDAADNCHIHYVLGNHDSLAPFVHQLQQLARTHENFFWHEACVRIGNSLFLHGDLPIYGRGRNLLHRQIPQTIAQRGRILNHAYRAFVATRLHRRVERFICREKCADSILAALQLAPPEIRDGITDIYFGHTHTPFSDFDYRGYRFHNTGSAIRHLELNMLPVRAEGNYPHGPAGLGGGNRSDDAGAS